ncbi:unnamed protein product [Rhizopus stolonifer]
MSIHFSPACLTIPTKACTCAGRMSQHWKPNNCAATCGLMFPSPRPLGCKWARSLGYGEAKPTVRENDHYLVCQDFIKVAFFCKNALDEQLMDGALGIHIVGRTIRFCALVLPAVATYVMYLLAEIKVSDSIQGLPGFITELPSVLKILHVFNTVYVSSDIPDIIAMRRAPTLPLKEFQ